MSQPIITAPSTPFVPGSVKPEADYLRMQQLGTQLGLPVMMAHLRVAAVDQDGVQGDVVEDRSRTFTRNYWNMIFNIVAQVTMPTGTFGAGSLVMKDKSSVTPTQYGNGISALFASAKGTLGIQSYSGFIAGDENSYITVGSGSAAESFDGLAMSAPIVSGSAAGQLLYGTPPMPANNYNAGTRTWTATPIRYFNNATAATIVVTETGIYGGIAGGYSNMFLFARDLLPASVAVLPGGQLTVAYSFSLVFPA